MDKIDEQNVKNWMHLSLTLYSRKIIDGGYLSLYVNHIGLCTLKQIVGGIESEVDGYVNVGLRDAIDKYNHYQVDYLYLYACKSTAVGRARIYRDNIGRYTLKIDDKVIGGYDKVSKETALAKYNDFKEESI